MAKERIEEKVSNLLSVADIKINGDRPWDIQVKNNNFYARVLSGGSLALGESYMDGWWEVERLDEFFNKLLGAKLQDKVKSLDLVFGFVVAAVTNRQNKNRAFNIGEAHYDVGNNLYIAMLDDRMVYTGGYFKDTENLNEAQEAKLDLVCRKIGLKKGQKVLDIGCGWGSFAKFAAEKYGAQVIGITVSKEQVKLGRENCAGLPVEIRLQDYRDVNEQFDHIISLGMIEHVGPKNYRTYMELVHKNLKDDGIFLLHTIGRNKSVRRTDPWINKYIFPDSVLPSITQLSKAAENLFVMEDWQSFGAHYDKTLMAWFKNFDESWPRLKKQYDERFYRMWKYYLLACAGSFRCRMNQLWQVVYTKNGIPEGYTTIR